MADFNTQKLVALIEDRRKPFPFALSNFFPTELLFDTEKINFDEVFENRRLAPFVSPVVEGKVMKSIGQVNKTFTPAYLKPKHHVLPSRAMKRRPGEALNGNMSPERRLRLIRMENFMMEDEMITNRLEWMAMQILRTGAVTVTGEDYPTQVVDFGRDASLDVTLLTTARWNDSAPDMLGDLESMSTDMSTLPHGAPATDVLMSSTPWNLFQKHDDIKDILNRDFRGNDSTSLERGPRNQANTVEMVGRVNNFRIWLDTREYEDEDGNNQKFLPDGEIVLTNPAIEGVQAFGAIQDVRALRAARVWPKSWEENDPSGEFTMTQSAPLPIPQRYNASGRIVTI